MKASLFRRTGVSRSSREAVRKLCSAVWSHHLYHVYSTNNSSILYTLCCGTKYCCSIVCFQSSSIFNLWYHFSSDKGIASSGGNCSTLKQGDEQPTAQRAGLWPPRRYVPDHPDSFAPRFPPGTRWTCSTPPPDRSPPPPPNSHHPTRRKIFALFLTFLRHPLSSVWSVSSSILICILHFILSLFFPAVVFLFFPWFFLAQKN